MSYVKRLQLKGDSINEVKSNMLEAVRIYIENNINFMENEVKSASIIDTHQKRSSVTPKW